MTDLQRFLRAVRTLEKLAQEYGEEEWLDVLGQHATVKQEGEVWFVGTFLDGIGQKLHERRVVDGYDHSYPHCHQCGKEIDDVRYDDRDRPRADALYCGPACRQKAYRARVTAKTAKSKRKRNGKNGNGTSLRLRSEKAAVIRNEDAARGADA